MAWKGNTVNNNVPNNFNNEIGYTGSPLSVNREEQLKVWDKFPDVTMDLYRIDETILKHINTVLSPTVLDNGNMIKVPVMIGSPERWASVKKDGIFRDQNGKIQKPLIMFKRTGFTKNDQFMIFNRHISYTFQRKYSEKNQYDQFSVLNRNRTEQPVTEFYSVTTPDHIIVTYEVVLWTDSTEQNNELIQLFNFATHEYWGEKNKYKFRTEISDFSNQSEVPTDQDRVIKTTFSLMVYAHLLPEKFENNKLTVQQMISPKKIVIKENVFGIQPTQTTGASDEFVNPNKNKANNPNVSPIKFVE